MSAPGLRFLRAADLVRSDPEWWHAPAAFTGLQAALFLIGLVPYIGALIVFVPALLMAVWMQGWVALAQQRALRDVPGLPPPFDPRYLALGLRSWIVMFVWSLPVVVTGVATGIIAFVVKRANGFDYRGTFWERVAADTDPAVVGALESIGMGLQVITILLLVVGPLLHVAVVRTNLAEDWSGLRAREVLVTLKHTAKEAYLGALLWVVIGAAMHALGLLMCCVGFYFGQALWFACFGIFWSDVYRLATERGAPPVRLDHLATEELARTFE
jgi:hypothetical protein